MAKLTASRKLASVVALALLASSCGGADTADAGGTAETTDAPASRPAPTDPAPVLDVTLATVAGGELEFGSLAGSDVMLWFWAPW